jgi:hypothetical protein
MEKGDTLKSMTKSKEELINESLESLDQALESMKEFNFKFCCFVDAFRNSIKRP